MGRVLNPSLMTTQTSGTQNQQQSGGKRPALSVVVPIHNEEENINPLVNEISAALKGSICYEIVYIDDDSTDSSHEVLRTLTANLTEFRAVQHLKKGGQSAAIFSGVQAANAPLVVTLDGDGQNDPADILALFEMYNTYAGENGRLMVAGCRKDRRDGWGKRRSSHIANAVRSHLLSDKTQDTGCGLKIFRREDFLRLPAFDHMHRFLPALMLRAGGRVMFQEVNHRPRYHGKSNYGTFDRLWVGITDMFGVIWLNRRRLNAESVEIKGHSDRFGST